MPSPADINRLRQEFARRCGADAAQVRTVFAPYRVCPLGAHIDHQLGRVTAMALDRGVLLAYAPLDQPQARMQSLDFPGETVLRFDDVPPPRPGDWGNYLRGAVCALRERYALRRGLIGLAAGSVSEGGLSSSAAVGVAYLLALEDVNALDVAPIDNVLLDQHIENAYLGLRNGVLDQSAILFSRKDCLTVIDCASLEHAIAPRPKAMPPFEVLIAFSGLRQPLGGTDYNRRVAECAEAAAALLAAAGRPGDEPVLRRLGAEEYAAFRHVLHGAPARRAAHFFSEMERVARGVEAWRRGDLAAFGRLVTDSGRSSIELYECGAPPLVELYRLLVETEGVYGARFSGAGFRGCCLALVEPSRAEAAARHVREAYAARFPDLAGRAGTMICRSDDGARIL
jgi:galacturonokinase